MSELTNKQVIATKVYMVLLLIVAIVILAPIIINFRLPLLLIQPKSGWLYLGIAILAGIIGATGGALQAFWKHNGDKTFKKNWLLWYWSCPLIGLFMGFVVFLIFAGLSTSGNSTVGEMNRMLLALVSIVAGVFYRDFLAMLKGQYVGGLIRRIGG